MSKNDEKPQKIKLKGWRRILALTCLLIYAMLIYKAALYVFTYLDDQGTIITEKVTSAIGTTYMKAVESYGYLKNPGSAEELAALMTEFYELLAEMGYYDLEKIDRAPHTSPSVDTAYAAELGFSLTAIDLLEKLPYLSTELDFGWSHGAGDAEFLLHGTFIDFRFRENLGSNADPFFALVWAGKEVKGFDEDGGRYMKPDYICLSVLGNHGSVMILNVQNFKLWTIDQAVGSTDPALADAKAKGDDNNYNSLDNYPSRPANLALQDYMQRFRELEWMPGGLYRGSYEGDSYARLYEENGWPSTFNRTAFQIAREKWEEEDQARWAAEQPFQEVEKFESWVKNSLGQIEEYNKKVSEVDEGKDIPDNVADRAKYRHELVREINKKIEDLPNLQHDLEAAREVLKGVDPKVRNARQDRIDKYGY